MLKDGTLEIYSNTVDTATGTVNGNSGTQP